MKVYYVRHAEPNYDEHDDMLRELTPKGMEDRKLVTGFLADKHIGAALSSPYKRAMDTIKEFTDSTGLAIETVNDFRERNIGTWVDDFNAYAARQWADFSYKLPGGECLREVRDRNIRALYAALKRYKGKNLVIGGHGTALCTLLSYFDPAFGYADFERCKGKMPWIVEFEFEDDSCELRAIRCQDLY